MARKIKRGRQFQPKQTRPRPQLWTDKDVAEFLANLDPEVVGWQREMLVKFGSRRMLGVQVPETHADHRGRSAGKTGLYRLTRELARMQGHEVREVRGGFEIHMATEDEIR